MMPTARDGVLRRIVRSAESPLSPAQRRLWILNRLEPANPSYNVASAVRLSGALDRAALEGAVADLVARHESLRTIFPEAGGIPRQHVLDREETRPSTSVARTTEATFEADATLAASTPFDLRTDLPLRAYLFEIGPVDHVLLLVIHHVATDGWSMQRVIRPELAASYSARHATGPAAREELPLQYVDDTAWKSEALGDDGDPTSEAARQLAYWSEALADLPDELPLPFDRPRGRRTTYRAGSVKMSLDSDVRRGVVGLARATACTPFMVLQAAVALLLTRVGAGTDIPVGTAVSGRNEALLEGLVGCFVNTIVLRTDTTGNPTFRELLQRVRERNLDAYEHDDAPFERVVETVKPHRSLARNPLFQVMLLAPMIDTEPTGWAGLHAQYSPVRSGFTNFDLTFSFGSAGRGAAGEAASGYLEYSADLFDPDTAERLVEWQLRLLEGVVADPDRPIGELPIITNQQRNALVNAWSAPIDAATLAAADIFEAQAARTPAAIAVRCEAEHATYDALNQRANRYAQHLIARGLGPEDVVGVALPRSSDLIAVMLAIWKAGAVYMPIDVEQPPERIGFMLDDAAASLVVTTRSSAGRVPRDIAQIVLDDDETRTILDKRSNGNPEGDRRAPLRLLNAAYLLYTSGSTGRPKGVIVSHQALASLLAGALRCIPFYPGDRFVALSTYTFDVSLFELIAPLCCGAEVHLATHENVRDRQAMSSLIGERASTTVQATPSYWQWLLSEEAAFLQGVRVISAGESLPAELAASLASQGASVWNGYGPTETTVYATLHGVDEADMQAGSRRSVPIGLPLANYRVYVLDGSLQPVPPGLTGEVYIGGHALARGYVRRAALTAERFLADPYGSPGSRMYRTGDIVKIGARDGRLEFVARTDGQLKVRGFRIEPGEIESALRLEPGVAQAIVSARESDAGEKRLVGYVVPRSGASVNPTELRRTLGRRLPDYLVPSAIVVLASLPRTPSGKLDWRALPAPDTAERPGSRHPSTPQESMLCDVCAEVLGRFVGLDDNFFDVGGHSLTAMRLVNRLRATMGIELPVASIFESTTIGDLLEHVAPQ
jgi:amino acid adenylation domain-containing protein